MSRPLIIIFLTVFVNLVGFGIIIPLLPFYAQTFGASPLVIGLLFASFSLSQLIATPALGVLSDRWGRRPVLIFSLLGTVISFVMNYTFAPLGSQKGPGVPMKGRLMDQVGLEVTDLKAYCDKLQAAGVKFDVPYGKDPELGLVSATITDPWGASIRLTQGLTKAVGAVAFRYTDPFLERR